VNQLSDGIFSRRGGDVLPSFWKTTDPEQRDRSLMPEQISLDGFEVPIAMKPTDRLFFAVFPDADAAARITQLAQRLREELELKGKPLATDRFHITLYHIGDFTGLQQDTVAKASKAASSVAASPFEVAFDRAMSFSGRPSNRPLVLRGGADLATLTAFQHSLSTALAKAGLVVKSAFTPHVTLLYDDRLVAEQAIEPIHWTAREFVLVHSLLGQTKHVPLARWSLR
jgi:2'-5' RNA ligase